MKTLTSSPRNDLTRWATTFGARYSNDIDQDLTHLLADPRKRTAKVRKAASQPRIKIVTAAWLYDSVNQWRALPEAPYLIPFEADSNDNRLDSNAPNFEELLESALSSQEDNEEVEGVELSLEMNGLPNANEEILESAVAEFTHEDWEGMRAEFEGLSSDSDEEDSTDGDSETSNASQESRRSVKKRKRDHSSKADTDGEESDGGAEVPGGSALQRRKKRAMERTTSLHSVMTLKPTNGSGTKPDDVTIGAAATSEGDAILVAQDDADAFGDELELDLEAEFEKELLAQESDEGDKPAIQDEHTAPAT